MVFLHWKLHPYKIRTLKEPFLMETLLNADIFSFLKKCNLLQFVSGTLEPRQNPRGTCVLYCDNSTICYTIGIYLKVLGTILMGEHCCRVLCRTVTDSRRDTNKEPS